PTYERFGTIPKRTGPRLSNTAPNSLYPTRDGEYIVSAANNDAIFRRLTEAMNRPDLAQDDCYRTQEARKSRVEEIDTFVSKWTETYEAETLEKLLIDNAVPCSRVYTMEDIFNDEHFQA